MIFLRRLALLPALLLLVLLPACQEPPEGMVKIVGGPFIMGTDLTDDDGRAEELGLIIRWFDTARPRHKVTLAPYFIDRTEVTNGDYARFVGATRHQPPPHWRGPLPAKDTDHHPVTHVTWFDADQYCKWAGKKLPSEAQWERAARGRNGQVYPWGNRFERDRVNVNSGHTTPVGSLPEGDSPDGVADMIGNVWEWTDGWFTAYPGSPVEDDKFGERFRVLRGNSWASAGHFPDKADEEEVIANNSRTTYRLYLTPKGRLNDVGFRCVKRVG